MSKRSLLFPKSPAPKVVDPNLLLQIRQAKVNLEQAALALDQILAVATQQHGLNRGDEIDLATGTVIRKKA